MDLIKLLVKPIKKTFDLIGYNLVLTKKSRYKNLYEVITPRSTYAPWLNDIKFKKTYKLMKNNTLVDKYRCYEIWKLVEEVKDIEGIFLEVGVWRGGTGSLIAKHAEILGIKDKVYLCDTFEGVVKASNKDSKYKGGEHSDTSREIVVKLLNKLNLKNVKILQGIFPDDSSGKISEKKIRYCHIDVDVYKSAKDIFDWVWPKLQVGGVVIFDDYGFSGCNGIRDFVNENRGQKHKLVIHNINGHGIIIKTK